MEWIKREPVRFWAAITGVIIAIQLLLVAFEVFSLTEDQNLAVLGTLVALGVLFQFFFVRERVTPFPPAE